MFSFRKRILTALALSLALALPTFAADPPARSIEKYLPDATDGVVTINVRQLLDSELIKKVGLDKALADESAQKTFKSLGLDPLKDVERLIIASNKEKPDEMFLVIEGKFDPAKLSAAAQSAAKEQKEHVLVHDNEYGKIYELRKLEEVVKLPPRLAGAGLLKLEGRSVYAVVADKGHVVLAGSKEPAEVVLLKVAGKKTTKLANKELAGLLAKINPKQSVAVAFPSPDEKIKSITGGITVTSDVKSRFAVVAADAETAKQLDAGIGEQLEMVRSLAAAGAGLEKGLEPAIGILKGIKHEAKDSTISLTSDVKGEVLEEFVKGLAALAAKQGLIP